MRRLPILALVIALFAIGMAAGWALRTGTPFADQRADQNTSTEPVRSVNAGEPGKTVPPVESTDRLRQIYSTGNGITRARLIAEIADDLNAAQVHAALAEMEKRHFPEKRELRVQLISRLAKLDPQAAIEYAKSITVFVERDEALRAAVKGWMEVEPVRASDWVLALKPPLKECALCGLIGAMAETDPKAAFTLIQKVRQGPDDALAEELFDQWTERDPAEAGAYAAKLPKGLLREQAMDVVASRWASRDLTGALAWAETMWDEKISRIEGRTYPSGRDAMTSVLQVWLRQDEDAAIRWIQQQPDEKKRDGIMATLIAAESDLDPEKTAGFIITKLEPGALQDKTLGQLMLGWAQDDRKSALAWLERQTDPRVQQSSLSSLAWSISAEEAPAIISLAEKLGGAEKETTIRKALDAWARGEPNAAAAWVDKQSPNFNYSSFVARSWIRNDPDAAMSWVNQWSNRDARDGFLIETASMVGSGFINPATAIRCVAEIANSQKREAAYVNLARAWLKRDTEAAQAWLRTAPLNQKSKDELLGANAK
jgi:hypothetical protein